MFNDSGSKAVSAYFYPLITKKVITYLRFQFFYIDVVACSPFTALPFLRKTRALPVNCWVIKHCLVLSFKVDYITSTERE